MEIFYQIYNTFEFQAFLKLVLGALLAGIIGLERSSLNKPAGFGTHALLGMSAVLVVLLSEYMSLYYDIDVARIPAQLLPSIGFIGAGTILRNGLNVKGVTTAAGILAVTCIGLAIGAGFYGGGIIATIIVYLLLAYAHNISDKFERFAVIDLEIKINDNVNKTIDQIEKYLNNKKIELKGIKRPDKEEQTLEHEIIEIVGTYDSRFLKKNSIISDLIDIENVCEVTDQE